MAWVETIVCSGKKGSDARLRRMLKARQEFKRRQEGCIGAWLGLAAESNSMMLVQSAFVSEEAWRNISTEIQKTLDAEDGGIEGLLLGPPLVGVFEIPNEELQNLVRSFCLRRPPESDFEEFEINIATPLKKPSKDY